MRLSTDKKGKSNRPDSSPLAGIKNEALTVRTGTPRRDEIEVFRAFFLVEISNPTRKFLSEPVNLSSIGTMINLMALTVISPFL